MWTKQFGWMFANLLTCPKRTPPYYPPGGILHSSSAPLGASAGHAWNAALARTGSREGRRVSGLRFTGRTRTCTGHTTSGHPDTLTGAVLPTKYRSVTRHITGSHGARVAQSAQVHQLPSAGAQQHQYCSPASAGHPPAVSLQRSGDGQSQAAEMSAASIRNARNPRLKAMQMQI